MTPAEQPDLFTAYLYAIQRIGAVDPSFGEATLYAPLDNLINGWLRASGNSRVQAVQQARTEYGVPDFVVSRVGAPLGYVEAKRPGTDLSTLRGRDREQFHRFANLDNVLYTNFYDFRLYQGGELVGEVSLGEPSLLQRPGAVATPQRCAEMVGLFARFAARTGEPVHSAAELARQLARATRVLRDATSLVLQASPTGPVARLKRWWMDLLFDDIQAREFADVYAQTVAYGLLTARLETSNRLTIHEAAAALHAHHPFLSAAFRSLTELEVLDVLGWAVDVVLATVQNVGLETFRRSRHPEDPLLYFYEDFLAEYDEELRKRRGVYYTPASVVDFQVRAIADMVEGLGRPRLLADDVVALDPAAGTGTYLLGLLDETARRVAERDGHAVLPAAMRRAAEHVIGFELLVGPYTVAHQRVSARLRGLGVAAAPARVYLVDTLAQPHDPTTGQLSLLDERLAEERADADLVKTAENVMVVLGNPPYDRATGRRQGDWLQGIMDLFTEPVRQAARVNLKNLADPYVQFYRWALWKLFESVPPSGPRLLSLITNRSYLLDYAFEGLRGALRREFDELWVVDLEGESRGPRATENVFDIRVGVCILVAVRRDSAADKEDDAVVRYTRFSGTRAEKEDALKGRVHDMPWTIVPGPRGEPFLPPVQGPWRRWMPLDRLMPVRQSGVQTKRDALVVAPTRERLTAKLDRFVDPTLSTRERARLFHETRDRSAPELRWDPSYLRRYGYRPLSRQWLYDDRGFIDFPRPKLHALWHPGQRAFVTLPKGHGSGPTIFQHTELPDLHAFRGSMGGHVFPFWLDATHEQPNLQPGFLERLQQRLGDDLTAADVFGYVYGLCQAPAYAELFKEGLAQGFPRLPFPTDRQSFDRVRELGGFLQRVHALENTVIGAVRLEGRPGPIAAARWADDRLHVGERAYLTPVDEAAWRYSVSGYQVLARWVRERVGLDLESDYDLLVELRRVAGAVVASAALGPDLDDALEQVLEGETLGEGSLLPLDPKRAAEQWLVEVRANERLAAEVREWSDIGHRALLRGESE